MMTTCNALKNSPLKSAWDAAQLVRTRRLRLIALSVLITLIMLLSDPASLLPRGWRENTLVSSLALAEAEAAISYVKNIGTYNSTGSSTSTTITAGASVVAGNSIIVTMAMDNDSAGAVSCSDNKDNTYTVDADIIYSSYVRTIICSAHGITALPNGDTVTVSHPSAAPRAMSVHEFSGLAETGTLDKTSTATGASSSPSSGSTATTQANDLLIGAIGTNGRITETFTLGSGYTALTREGTDAFGRMATNNTINPEYRIVSATGAYEAYATITRNQWAAAIATYKAALYRPD